MEPTMAGHEAIDHDDLAVRNWRRHSSSGSGSPDRWPRSPPTTLDWHQMARLVQGAWEGATGEERRVLRSNPICR